MESRPKKRVHPMAAVNGKELGSQSMIQSPADDLSRFLGPFPIWHNSC